jgi:hypothetical protein
MPKSIQSLIATAPVFRTPENAAITPIRSPIWPGWTIRGSKAHSTDLNTATIGLFNVGVRWIEQHAGKPAFKSELSGEPAYALEVVDGFDRRKENERYLILTLTADELRRICLHALTPAEFLKLKARYGIFFELHEDFYNADGAALQPKVRPARKATKSRKQ